MPINPGEREISNPSDRVFIQYEADTEAAEAAVLILGRGAYGLIPITEAEECMPILLWGVDRWAEATKGKGVKDWFESIGTARVAAALDSVRCDGERTSMNDIAGKAHKMAARLRELDALGKEKPA